MLVDAVADAGDAVSNAGDAVAKVCHKMGSCHVISCQDPCPGILGAEGGHLLIGRS